MTDLEFRRRLPCLILFLFLVVAGGGWATSPLLGQEDVGANEGATEEVVVGEEVVAVDVEAAGPEAAADGVDSQAAAEGAEESDWQANIDDFFGKYVVAPVETVIFFDFYTGPWKDSNGKAHPGWLGTSVPFVVAWLLLGGVFLTIRMGFINLKAPWHAIQLARGRYDNPDEPGEVTHFQALSTALSATVGLGNIGGVAVAIGLGGPGATFWMIVVGLVGMSTKFAECSLGQLYRTVDSRGHVLGGPMRYLKQGLTELGLPVLGKVLAFIFAILCIGASFGGGNAYQINQSLAAIRTDITFLDQYPWVYGLLMTVLVGVVIVGGIKSIGRVAGAIVPMMCMAYMLAALYILFAHTEQIPAALASVFTEAFTPGAGYGGVVGVMVIGIQRAAFSNEAGVGSAPIAHSAAKTDEPISEGIVALLEPFIDTVLVCTTTALVIIVSQAHVDPANAEVIQAKEGAALTLAAFRDGGHEWFGYILFLAVVMFAFSTCISWSYYGERSFVQLFGAGSSIVYRFIFLLFTFLGSIIAAKNVLAFSDLMLLGMCLPNLLGVFLLSGVVKRRLDMYWLRYTSGDLDRQAEAYRESKS